MVGKSVEFIWNAERLPGGCSEFPSTRIQSCETQAKHAVEVRHWYILNFGTGKCGCY